MAVTPNFPEVITPAENHDWGTTDLFPTFGMPSCPRRNPQTDRSRAVTTGDLPPMAPPGTKRSLDRNVQLRLGGRLTTGINHPACWSRIWAQNKAKSIRTTATQCNKLDGSTSLTCSYETDRTGGDRDGLAHNPEVAGSNPVPATTVMSRDIGIALNLQFGSELLPFGAFGGAGPQKFSRHSKQLDCFKALTSAFLGCQDS